MKKRATKKKESYNSLAEFQETFLPLLYKTKHGDLNNRGASAYGTALAKDILSEIEQGL
jgi:hypothetical protein